MKKETTYTTICELEIDLDIDVSFLDARILTTTDLSKFDKHFKSEKGKKYLCISIEIQLDDFESVSDGAAYARPRLLIILGVLSFLTQELFTPFEFLSNTISIGALERGEDNKFIFNESNYLPDIEQIIVLTESHDENKKRLFYSLIDRFRKALFLEKESEENMIHDDEVLLSHFHILELLSTKYYAQQKQLAIQTIKEFSENILANIYLLEGNHLQTEQSSKSKLVESIFIPELPVASKIMFMLQQQGILTHRLKSFISDLVKDRNAVAHGRQVYQERVIFPVPPFFPLIRNRDYSIEMLRILSGRTISRFLELDNLNEEWTEFHDNLPPSIDELNSFINEKEFEKITIDDFYGGNENDITPYTFAYYLLSKKLKIENVIPALSNIILNYREIEEEIIQIILAVVLVVDNASDKLKEKCIEVIKLSSEKGWLPNFKMRDVLYYLEYLGHEPKILRDMIENQEIK